MTSVISDTIRPVEVLWLRTHREGEQGWSRENALQAVLMDLSVRGLLEPEDKGKDAETFEPTEDAQSVDGLRSYESEVLEAIEGEDDQQKMGDAVYQFNFEDFFIDAGLLAEVEHSEERGLPFIPKSWYSYTAGWSEVVETDAYDEVMGWVSKRRSDLKKSVSQSEVRVDMLPLLLAFPNADFMSDVDLEDADEFAVDVSADEMDVASMDATNTAAIAAASAGACAAASSACASSAESACASAGAAGGAAGAGGAGGM